MHLTKTEKMIFPSMFSRAMPLNCLMFWESFSFGMKVVQACSGSFPPRLVLPLEPEPKASLSCLLHQILEGLLLFGICYSKDNAP